MIAATEEVALAARLMVRALGTDSAANATVARRRRTRDEGAGEAVEETPPRLGSGARGFSLRLQQNMNSKIGFAFGSGTQYFFKIEGVGTKIQSF